MSTFSTKGGLYERAAKRYGLADGKKLFGWAFFSSRRADAQAFLADVWAEAARAAPTRAHTAVAALADAGVLLRHYTLNVDGLAAAAGLSTWHPEACPDGARWVVGVGGWQNRRGGGGEEGGEARRREGFRPFPLPPLTIRPTLSSPFPP